MSNPNQAQIGHREALTLLIVMMSGKVFLSYPRDMALLGAGAGWMIVLLAGVFSIVGFFFINSLVKKFPSLNIVEIAHQLAGKLFGSALGFVIFLFFLILTSLMLRKFAETFILAILPRTPISVIILFFLSLLMYATFLGIETLSRVAWFYGPYLLMALVAILLFSAPQGDYHNLLPVLGNGPGAILKQAVIHISMFAELLLFGFIAPLVRKKEKIFGIGFYSLLIATFINTVVTFMVIYVFNYIGANKLIFPIFQLSRLIAYGEFIQRVESLFVFLWFFAAGIQMGGLFYATVVSYAQSFKIKNYRPLIFPIALLAFTISLIPGSMTDTIVWNDFVLSNYYWGIAFGIPGLLWVLSLIFKKKRSESYG